MGKNIENQESISLEYVDPNPGCMRGIFHHINHPKWYHVKKRLPYKIHRSGRSHSPVATGDPDKDSITNASTEVEEKSDGGINAADSEIVTKSSESSSSLHRSSMKSKIKAFTEEVSKRRGRHRRSTSDPARLPPLERSASIHHLEDSTLHLPMKDPIFPKESSISSKMAYMRQNEVSEFGKNKVKDHTLLQESLVYAVEQSKNSSSLQDSKLFLDALDLLNIRKEFFLKVLQDPKSSLSLHLRRHKASVRKLRLHKSMSFPVSGSSARTHRSSSTSENEHLMNVSGLNSSLPSATGEIYDLLIMPTVKYQVHECPSVETDPQADKSLGLSLDQKERHSNKLVMKRFKKLREKVKNALKENKKERYRIIMDSFLHKVPYGRGFAKSNNNKQEVSSVHPAGGSVRDKYIKYRSVSSLNRKNLCLEKQQIRRTSSFNESLERYNRLLELCIGKEEQGASGCSRQTTDTPSPIGKGSSTASLERIHSLPDLRSYSLSRFEESSSTSDFPVEMISRPSTRFEETKFVGIGTPSYQNWSEEFPEVSGTGDNFGRVKKPDDAFSKFEVDASETCSTMFSADEDLEPIMEESYLYDEDFASQKASEFCTSSSTSPENNKNNTNQQTSSNMQGIQVDTRIEKEFNYIRDVLELSGFNGNEFFKKWSSLTDQQPLDLSVFEEVEDFLQAQPKFAGNKEGGGNWNHILLFDLINEVLLDMSQRSFSYWPAPLTYSCHTQRILVGYRVLEELWKNISWYLSGQCVAETSLDRSVSRDLSKDDGWMNIQFEAECVGIELEEWIFDGLLDEIF